MIPHCNSSSSLSLLYCRSSRSTALAVVVVKEERETMMMDRVECDDGWMDGWMDCVVMMMIAVGCDDDALL